VLRDLAAEHLAREAEDEAEERDEDDIDSDKE
jgi:hypothetical protein